jgi:hypothetical protein
LDALGALIRIKPALRANVEAKALRPSRDGSDHRALAESPRPGSHTWPKTYRDPKRGAT